MNGFFGRYSEAFKSSVCHQFFCPFSAPYKPLVHTHTHTCNFVFQIKGFITLKATDFRGSFEVQ